MTGNFHPIREQIANILTERFKPVALEVIDDSDKHIGHAGHNGKGESHFMVRIVSTDFEGRSRIERHRMVYEVLNTLIPPIHALQIKAETP